MMNLFEVQKRLFEEANIRNNDITRRIIMMKYLSYNNMLNFKKELLKGGVQSSIDIVYAGSDISHAMALKDTYICDINLKLENMHNIIISVFSDKLIFNMSSYNIEDCRYLFSSLISSFISDAIKVSDINCIEIINIKIECIKEWCMDYGFEIIPDFMNKPTDDYSVNMIIRR